MRKTLRKLAETPERLELHYPGGDFLSDVLGASLIRHALYSPIDALAPWVLRVPRQSRASFYLVAKGGARLEVAGEPPHVLSPGEVAFVPHGTAHVLRDAGATRGAVSSLVAGFIELSPSHGAGFLKKMPQLVVLSANDPTSGPWVASVVQFMLAESATSLPASSIVLQRLADVLFVLAVRSVAASGQCQRSGLSAVTDPRIYQAMNCMHERVAEPWTVELIARLVGMSRSGFAARFTELVGEPPLQYLGRWRVARAAELLRTTADKVETIAGQVGYTSVPAFSRVFKRWQGTGPAAFRRTVAG